MEGSQHKPPRFFGYPKAVEGPSIRLIKASDTNPVFGGTILVFGAWLYVSLPLSPLYRTDQTSVSKLEFIQRFLWANAGFNSLRNLKHLEDYYERWDVSFDSLKLDSDD